LILATVPKVHCRPWWILVPPSVCLVPDRVSEMTVPDRALLHAADPLLERASPERPIRQEASSGYGNQQHGDVAAVEDLLSHRSPVGITRVRPADGHQIGGFRPGEVDDFVRGQANSEL
jgi:hypothetical protein